MGTAYRVPSSFPMGGMHALELQVMARFLLHSREQIEAWLSTDSEGAGALVDSMKRVMDFVESSKACD